MVEDLHHVKGYDVHHRMSHTSERNLLPPVPQKISLLRVEARCHLHTQLTIATDVMRMRKVVQISVIIDLISRVVAASTIGIMDAVGTSKIKDLTQHRVTREVSLGNRLPTKATSSIDWGTVSKGKEPQQ